MRCTIRLALAGGSEFVVSDDRGDMERRPAISTALSTAELSEAMDGAEGGEVCAGTDAKYSAPP